MTRNIFIFLFFCLLATVSCSIHQNLRDYHRTKRDVDNAFKDFIKWMTPEQLKELEELKAAKKSDEEIRVKVTGFFGQLPADKQTELKTEFKGKCKEFFAPLLTAEESTKMKTFVEAKDKASIGEIIKNVVERQDGNLKVVATKMTSLCREVFKDSSRKRRNINEAFKEFIQWMTPEQQKEVGEMKTSGSSDADIRTKVFGFFGQLPAEKQAELKTEFRGKCREFFAPLLTAEESVKIKTMAESKDKTGVGNLIKAVVDRQDGNLKEIAEKMSSICRDVYKDTKRKRRNIDTAFKDFVQWLTPEQLAEVGEMKAGGSSEDEIRTKIYGFFDALPADKQAEIKTELKGKCREFFGPLLNEEERTKIKTLTEAKDREAAGAIVKKVVDRQDGDLKVVSTKMFEVCGAVYKDSKKKRDVQQKIEKHLAWLRPEEKEEILKMTKEGKSQDEIKKRLFDIIQIHEKDTTLKDQTVKRCYQWMDEVATKEEIESLHKLHHVDHGACKKKVREFISRLPIEKQKSVEQSLPFCEKLWYGDHADHSNHNHQHHHRRRRHLAVLDKYLEWLEPSQKDKIREMEAAGVEFGEISDKIKEYFKLLPNEKQDELKTTFKKQCLTWAKEVAKPGEWEDIKKHYKEEDYHTLIEKLIELEGRLTENQKHTIEHLRGVCYKLWGIKHRVSRLRRVARIDPEYALEMGNENMIGWRTDRFK